MNESTKRRVARLEARRKAPLRTIVTYPGDPWPEDLPPGVQHIAVEFVATPEQDYTVTHIPPREADDDEGTLR